MLKSPGRERSFQADVQGRYLGKAIEGRPDFGRDDQNVLQEQQIML